MKAYMAYSYTAGSSEGAVLIFANTIREAKKLAWDTYISEYCDGEWTDLRVSIIKNQPWLFKEMTKETPHVIESPKSCDHCTYWGNSEIGEDGLCDDCREEIKEDSEE